MRTSSALPLPPPNFSRKKECILELLAVPEAEYSDASPKGSVDAEIRDLIEEINAMDGFVTTSSCAGRVSVFVEGRKAGTSAEEDDAARPTTVAAAGGKGGGGTWLFVSHDPVEENASEGVRGLLGLRGFSVKSEGGGDDAARGNSKDTRLVHFKFEPMILHVLTASLEHAQVILRCALQAGFRESGAVNLTSSGAEAVTPIVAVRSMGLSLESLIGIQEDGATRCTVSDDYLLSLLRIANERFEENKKRIERFRTAILEVSYPPRKRDGTEWEDAQTRRERKRMEGLRRKAELERQNKERGVIEGGDDGDLDFPVNTEFT
ncbi:methyltransferase TYW3-domain-containing protein [Xylaria bambusicola]|uniref:methyltransferase TYW3-domain-containing protein n=1 Tax=Xylaria bambusicola TaxID=326684 RepID=UPI00200845A7|nr:methyltransferase TYW3-domain-containing protein [Xylaria bambusicola]KAI0521137.1 methyltransferase TYW3-domain-containing protein [Xylaria bambusicola]